METDSKSRIEAGNRALQPLVAYATKARIGVQAGSWEGERSSQLNYPGLGLWRGQRVQGLTLGLVEAEEFPLFACGEARCAVALL
jgi:hypothetical protein